jgi:hypothetical protein
MLARHLRRSEASPLSELAEAFVYDLQKQEEPLLLVIDDLLQSALRRPPGQREAFLKEAGGGDETLRREVKSLRAGGPSS